MTMFRSLLTSLSASALALFLGLTPALAQDPTPAPEAAPAVDEEFEARKAVATEYRLIFMEATDLDAMIGPMTQPLLQQIAARQPELWAEKQEVLVSIISTHMLHNIEIAFVGMDDQMARVFSMEELVALRDFYASPEGRSVMGKMPVFMQEIMPGIMQQAMGNVQGLLDQLAAEGVKVQ